MTTTDSKAAAAALVTVTRVARATAEQLADKAITILPGKYQVGKEIAGAATRKNDDGTISSYSGDILIMSPLPAIDIQSQMAGLSPANISFLDDMLTSMRSDSLRAAVKRSALGFGDSLTINPTQYTLQQLLVAERVSDGLTQPAVDAVFNSSSWLQIAPNWYAANGVSLQGACNGEKLMRSVLKPAPTTPAATWEALANRLEAISGQIALDHIPTEAFTSALTLILARLKVLASKPATVAEGID